MTPFDAAGAVAPAAIEPLVERLLPHGIAGIVALGTTGEAAHVNEDEAEQIVAAVVRAVRGRVPVLCGSGRPSTRNTIAATQRLAAAGANGALVLTPAVYRPRMDGAALQRHYAAVADASPIPVFVYHIPDVTGLELQPETLAAIVAHPNVWGFKDSSPTGGPLAAALQQCGADTTAGFVGGASRLVAGLAAGAAGGILAVANAVPAACVGLYTAWREGRREEYERWQAAVAAVAHAWVGGWAVAGIKSILRAEGIDAGRPRSPLDTDLPPEVEAALARACAAAGVGAPSRRA